MPILPRLLEVLEMLSDVEQKEILGEIIARRRPPGIPGAELIEWAKAYPIPAEELDLIEQAIQEEFSKIDRTEWDKSAFPD